MRSVGINSYAAGRRRQMSAFRTGGSKSADEEQSIS